jgi:hypothetical protein
MATRRIGLLWHLLNATLTGATTNKWLARSNKSRLSRLECTSQAAGRFVFFDRYRSGHSRRLGGAGGQVPARRAHGGSGRAQSGCHKVTALASVDTQGSRRKELYRETVPRVEDRESASSRSRVRAGSNAWKNLKMRFFHSLPTAPRRPFAGRHQCWRQCYGRLDPVWLAKKSPRTRWPAASGTDPASRAWD